MENLTVTIISAITQAILLSLVALIFFWIKTSSKKNQKESLSENQKKESLSDYRNIFIWVIILILIIVINSFRVIKNPRDDSTQTATIDDVMTELIMITKDSLPIKIDESTTLTNVSYANKEFIYEYELQLSFAGKAEVEKVLKPILYENLVMTNCEVAKVELDKGISYVYKYKVKESSETWQIIINKDDCEDKATNILAD